MQVKTQMVGSGIPRAARGGDAAFDGYVDCASAAELKQWVEAKEMEEVFQVLPA